MTTTAYATETAGTREAATAPVPGTAPQPGQQAGPQPGRQPAPVEAYGHANAFAVTSFVLGIASIVSSWTFVAPIAGLILGILALRRGTGERTLALWGVWMNAIMLAGTVLAVLLFVLIGGASIIATLPFWG